VPLGVMAIMNLLSSVLQKMKVYTGAGILVEIVIILCWLALPGTAVLAALMWAKPRFSQFIVTLGLLIGFGAPLLVSLLPNRWWVGDTVESDTAVYYGTAMGGGYAYYLALTTILALGPGVLRASSRLKALLPESTFPGVVLVSVAPIVSLLIIGIPFIFNQMPLENHILLWLTIILLAVAPLIYTILAGTFIRPIATPGDRAAVNLWGWISFGIAGAGGLCLIIFLILSLPSSEEKKAALDDRLAQLDPKDLKGLDMPDVPRGGRSGGKPSSASEYKMKASIPIFLSLRLGFEFLGRALFATVWASQFLVWASALAARSGQPLAQNAERRMAELEPVVGKI